ncbi:MAG: substrate-binding domain-containing protein [Gemmatimonadales bacterium]
MRTLKTLANGAAAVVLAFTLAPPAGAQARPDREVILATTTSLNDSGLLDSLAPAFERASGYHLRTVAVGSGQALRMGERGDADVVFAHSPAAEAAFMAKGFGIRRLVVATNYFTVVGPADDPDHVREAPSAPEALRRIAAARGVFVSRGDSSGTNARELQLWRAAGGRPEWPGYLETGQGQAATLLVANERRGYTLTDRSTFGALRRHLDLVPLREDEPALLNIYHVIELNPAGRPGINAAGGHAFAEFLTSPATQDLIARFGTERYGAPLFRAARGVEPN